MVFSAVYLPYNNNLFFQQIAEEDPSKRELTFLLPGTRYKAIVSLRESGAIYIITPFWLYFRDNGQVIFPATPEQTDRHNSLETLLHTKLGVLAKKACYGVYEIDSIYNQTFFDIGFLISGR